MAPSTKSVKVSARSSYFTVSHDADIDEKTDYDAERHLRESQPPQNPTLLKSVTHHDHKQHKFYKPRSNSSWVLSLFLVAITVCVLLLEIVQHTHPSDKDVTRVEPRGLSVEARAFIDVRQEANSGSLAETSAKPATRSTPESTPSATVISTSTPVVSSTPAPNDKKTSTTPVSDDAKISTLPSPNNSDPPSSVTVGEPYKGNQLTITTSNNPTTTVVAPGQPYQGDQLTITTSTPKAPPTTAASINQAQQLSLTTVVPSADKSQQLTLTTSDQGKTGAPNPANEITVTTAPTVGEPYKGNQLTITTSNGDQGKTIAPDRDNQITITTAPTVGEPYKGSDITITTNNPQISSGAQISITSNSPNNGAGSPISGNQISITSGVGQPLPQNQLSNTQTSTTAGAGAGAVVLAGVASVVSGSLIASGTAIVGTVPPAVAASVVSGSLVVSGSSVIGTVQQNAGSGTRAGVAAVGSITLTDSAGKPTATVAYTGDVIVTDANGKATTISYDGNIVLTNSNGVATQTLSNAVLQTDSEGRVTGTLSYADNVVLTDSNGTPTKTVLYTGTATQTAIASGTNAASVDSKSASAKSQHFTGWSYFMAMYLPNILGVFLQSSWLVVFVTFKLMEPFYQLASPGGASAESSLTADYLAAGLSPSVFKTAADGHWVLILAGMVQVGFALAMLFVTDTMNVVATAYCKTNLSDRQPCEPKWVVDTETLRIVEVILVACFSMIIMIIVLNRKRVSGVYSDPSRISTVADVLTHKPLIHELRDLPPTATKSSLALELKDNRYMLGTFFDQGKEHYGIVKLDVPMSRSNVFKKEAFYKRAYRRVGALSDYFAEGMNASVPFLPDFLCMAFTIILFSLVLAYYCISAPKGQNAFNDWMNSTKTGPGLVLTILGILMGFLVKRKERYFRLSHSYVLLGMGPTPAHKSVTSSTHTTPFDSVYKSATSGHTSLTLLSLAAILTDIILILAPTIPFRFNQIEPVYISSTYIVLTLSALILLIIAGVTYREYVTGHNYADCPENLACVLMRLCASRFVDEKNVMDEGPWKYGATADKNCDHDELQRVRYGGVDGERKYMYGVMEGLDGVQRYMVEEDVHAGSWMTHK